ncbi:MAG: hypothetical protein IMW96_07825 [Thermoanaerobacteraceae bacterium]|nr:hypothetical protein [Thermoanaerobacteraceae bacterium]
MVGIGEVFDGGPVRGLLGKARGTSGRSSLRGIRDWFTRAAPVAAEQK